MADNGLISCDTGGKFTIVKRFGGRLARFVEFFATKAAGDDMPPPAPMEELSDTTPVPEEWTQGEIESEELPF